MSRRITMRRRITMPLEELVPFDAVTRGNSRRKEIRNGLRRLVKKSKMPIYALVFDSSGISKQHDDENSARLCNPDITPVLLQETKKKFDLVCGKYRKTCYPEGFVLFLSGRAFHRVTWRNIDVTHKEAGLSLRRRGKLVWFVQEIDQPRSVLEFIGDNRY